MTLHANAVWLARGLAILVLACGAGGAFAPAALAAPLTVEEDGEDGSRLVVTWRPDGTTRVGRIVLPPGRRAVIAEVRGARALPSGSVRLEEGGWDRRVPFATLVLDAASSRGGHSAAPARPAGPVEILIDFVQGEPPAGPPPMLLDDAALSSRAGREALGGRILNPGALRAARAADLRPPGLVEPRRGRLSRHVARSLAVTSAEEDGQRRLSTTDILSPAALDAGRVKLLVTRDGIHRVTGADLEAAGVDLAGLAADELRLVTRSPSGGNPILPTNGDAEPVAIEVVDVDGDGLFEAEDSFAFWGLSLTRDELANVFQGADYTDTNSYVLDAVPGGGPRVGSVDASAPAPAASAYLETVRLEEDSIFLGNHRTRLFNVSHFYSCPSLIWDGRGDAVRVESLPIDELASAAGLEATLRVRMLARTSMAGHHTLVELNGTLVSDRLDDGYTVIDHVATGLSPALLSEGANDVTVRLRDPGCPGSCIDRAELDWIELEYPRRFVAVDDALDFRHASGARVSVEGVSAGAVAWDVSDPARPLRLDGAEPGAGTLAFTLGEPGERAVAVAGPSGMPRPAIEWLPETTLRDPSHAVDLVIIGPRVWVDPPTASLSEHVAHREAQGLSTLVVSFETLVDEFMDGIWTPFATGFFLIEAFAEWERPPRYGLLLGDATVDHQDRLGGRILLGDCSEIPDDCGFHETEWAQHVPTRIIDNPADQIFLGYYASDSSFAFVAGSDWLPDVALGRLPARSASELDALLEKARVHEGLAASPPDWASRALMTGDQIVTSGEEVIEESQDAAHARYVAPRYDRTTFYYQSDYGASDPSAWTSDFLQAWQDPAQSGALVSYVGHGSAFRWSGANLFTNNGAIGCRDDVPEITGPGIPEPVVLNANCITGAFMHLLSPSLIEEAVRAPEGGAIAGFGPTGITFISDVDRIVDAFYDGVLGPDACSDRRLGDVLLRIQGALAPLAAADEPGEILSNVLLGDPALALIVPRGPDGAGLTATSRAGAIDLSWDDVGADAHDVFRADGQGSTDFVRVAADVVGTTWTDTGVVDGVEYTHAIAPIVAGHPGCWSERATARPCTMDAPTAPTGGSILSAPCDGCALVDWTPADDPEVAATVMRLHHGTSTADPVLEEWELGPSAAFDNVCGLVPHRDHVLSIATRSHCGVESATAAEIALRIECPLTLDRPAFVPDLRVTRSGADIVLAWSEVTQTVQGEALPDRSYVVYRAADPSFVADASAEIGATDTPDHVDPGRIGAPPKVEFWAVAAVEPGGLRGAVAHDHPQGVRDLRRDDAGTDWRLTWSPVRHDLRGLRTPVARYLVFADTVAIGRADVEGRSPDVVVTGPEAVLPKALGDFHVVVPEDVHGNRSLD